MLKKLLGVFNNRFKWGKTPEAKAFIMKSVPVVNLGLYGGWGPEILTLSSDAAHLPNAFNEIDENGDTLYDRAFRASIITAFQERGVTVGDIVVRDIIQHAEDHQDSFNFIAKECWHLEKTMLDTNPPTEVAVNDSHYML